MPAGSSTPPPVAQLKARLGLPVDSQLLERALTHRSYAYENGGLPTNERLEFLGDSVLGLVVTDALFHRHPELSEGQLAKLRAAVVNMRALADVGRALDLGRYVRLGRGEEATGGRDKSSILADTVEALIGAVYLDSGLDAASTLVHNLVDDLIVASATLGAGLDWKTSLQELTSQAMLGVPEYHVSETGPDHEKLFTAAAVVAGRVQGVGQGRSKKEAEAQAAQAAWSALRSDRPAEAGAMPELPEVEVVRRGLARHVVGRTVDAVEVRHPRAVRRHAPGSADFVAALAGARFETANRRGKYLWLPLDWGHWAADTVGNTADNTSRALLAHLGMSGQLLVVPSSTPDGPHLRVRMCFTDGGTELRFVDQRTFGGLAVTRTTRGGVPIEIEHIALDPGRAVRRCGLPAGPPSPSHRNQAGPARPDVDLRRREHLRRRGTLARPPAFRPGHRDDQGVRRSPDC